MSKKSTKAIIKNELKELEKEELRLFHIYNRHAIAQTKLSVLNQLITVITKIENHKLKCS